MISASLSLSLPRLGWKSTSTPRSLKICTAAGDRASEMRTRGVVMLCPVYRLCSPASPAKAGDPVRRCALFKTRTWWLLDAPLSRGMTACIRGNYERSRRLGQRVLGLAERPVEPGGERLDVAR